MKKPQEPLLTPECAIKLLDEELQPVSKRLTIAYSSSSVRDGINYGSIQAFYQSIYNILWRSFGNDHRVTQHFLELYRIQYPSFYDELSTLHGAAVSAKKELTNAVKYPDSMKFFYNPKIVVPSDNIADNRKIFVVHGRNEEKRKELHDFLKKIETEPIILEDQTFEASTVLDQFEHYANSCSFAVVLMTADDFGGLYDISLLKNFSTSKEEEMKINFKNQPAVEARARQNVITELGYFWGRLGLKRVRILYEDGVTKPSDIDAALYIKLDDKGLWKHKIARELDSQGIKIQMSLLDPLPE